MATADIPVVMGITAESPADMADRSQALNSWTGLSGVVDAAGGAGSLFLGVSMAAAGWAVVAHRALPVILGWIGVLGGATTVLTIFSPDTALSGLAGLLYVLSLLLAIVFRVWAGITLTTGRVYECTSGQPAVQNVT